MTIPRPRLTVRRLIALGALVGVVAFGIWMKRLHDISGLYAPKVGAMRTHFDKFQRGARMTRAEWVAEWRAAREQGHKGGPPPEVCRVMADHYQRLEETYRLATLMPWFPVEPDPPLPEIPWTEPE